MCVSLRLVRHTGRKTSRDARGSAGMTFAFAGKLAYFAVTVTVYRLLLLLLHCTDVYIFFFTFSTFLQFSSPSPPPSHRLSLSPSALCLCLTRLSHTHSGRYGEDDLFLLFTIIVVKKTECVECCCRFLRGWRGEGSLRTPDRYLHAAGHPHGPVGRR